MLDQYAKLCRDLLAIPIVKGAKSPSESFAGAKETFTIEALMQNGWALQSGMSHFLSQSGKSFNVTFQGAEGKQQDVWGTLWGVSTCLIGALNMSHSDDAKIVLLPCVSPVQVVVVPIPPKKNDKEGKISLNNSLEKLVADLSKWMIKIMLKTAQSTLNGRKRECHFKWNWAREL